LIGAPLPAVKEALAPEALQHQFILTSALLNALFWLVLGAASAWFYIRANRSAVEGDQPSTTAAMSAAN
jgi:predicted cobalt transporter CbtA